VASFRSVKEAKDYIAERIAAEAARESVPLSEVERKMLYWPETDWTLPDMKQVGAEFERDYDDTAYEQKITRLIANLTADHHHRNEAKEEKWDAAVYKLAEGDHYLSVLVRDAQPSGFWTSLFLDRPFVRPPHDFLKLLLTALTLIFAFFAIDAILRRFFASKLWLSMGWDIDERGMGFAALLVMVGVFLLGARLWQLIRARTNRP
jgi:hypothetical protein